MFTGGAPHPHLNEFRCMSLSNNNYIIIIIRVNSIYLMSYRSFSNSSLTIVNSKKKKFCNYHTSLQIGTCHQSPLAFVNWKFDQIFRMKISLLSSVSCKQRN